MITDLPDECYAVLLVNGDGFLVSIAAALRVFVRSRNDTALEVLALRQQLAVLKRKLRRPRLSPADRLFWSALRRLWPRWAEVVLIVARNGSPLASNGLPDILALAITVARRPAKGDRRTPSARSKAGTREFDLGSTKDPRRTAEAGFHCLRANRGPLSAPNAAPR